MRVAVVQTNSASERAQNLARASALVDQAGNAGADLVLLPEYVTFLGPPDRFQEMCESIPGPTTDLFGGLARRHRIYLHGGSLIERAPVAGRYFNTSVLFGPQGDLVATYRKIHLFDVDVPDQVTETESAAILPGDTLTLVALPEITLGLSTCFDVRFPEMYRQLAVAGAEAFAVPAAFARATGRAHWEVLLRARAIENHAYVLAAAQHGQDTAGRWRYGRSMIVDPWGQVLAQAPEEGEHVLTVDIRRDLVQRRRREMPVLALRRPDVYASLTRSA